MPLLEFSSRYEVRFTDVGKSWYIPDFCLIGPRAVGWNSSCHKPFHSTRNIRPLYSTCLFNLVIFCYFFATISMLPLLIFFEIDYAG